MINIIIISLLIFLNILIFIFGSVGFWQHESSKPESILDFYDIDILFFVSIVVSIIITSFIVYYLFTHKEKTHKKIYLTLLISEIIICLGTGVCYFIESNITTGYLAGVCDLLLFIVYGYLFVHMQYKPGVEVEKNNNPTIEDKINKIKELKDKGFITEQDYNSKKEELVNKIINSKEMKNSSNIEDKLLKLEEMKKSELINEEEYVSLKNKYLKDYCD